MRKYLNSAFTVGCPLCLRNCQKRESTLILWMLLTGCLDGQRLEMNKIGKLVMKKC